jgi:hypothetical protein
MFLRWLPVLIVLLTTFSCGADLLAQTEPSAPPVPIERLVGKTGAFQATIAERSPLSAMPDVAKRMGVPNNDGDYKLANEKFTMYLPKEPAEDGKFGVMVSVCFIGYGFQPPAWTPMLEKYHLIWICPHLFRNNLDSVQRV